MVHIHVGWDKHLLGARNSCKGEYDASQYSVLVVGIPVYFSFQGCYHVIPKSKLKTGERKELMLTFAQTFLGCQDLAKQTLLPLKPKRDLKRMWFYEYFLWLSGLTIVPVVTCLLIAMLASPAPNNNDIVLAFILWLSVVLLFLAAFVRCLFLRRPSAWQVGIRGVVASRLGPFSDPADWTIQLVSCVTPVFGIREPTSEKLIQKAEQLLKLGHYEDALIAARMTLALVDAANNPSLADRAESITEQCLRTVAEEY
jgi:hypothetical protein